MFSEPTTVLLRDERDVVILNADAQPAFVKVLTKDSQRYRRTADAISRRAIASPINERQQRIELMSALVVEWNAWDDDGIPLPLTPLHLAALLSSDHVLRQIEEGVHGQADFFASIWRFCSNLPAIMAASIGRQRVAKRRTASQNVSTGSIWLNVAYRKQSTSRGPNFLRLSNISGRFTGRWQWAGATA